MPDRLGWKVVAEDQHGVMYSCASKFPVRYQYDIWTSQPTNGGPLTVFTSRSAASVFISNRARKLKRNLKIKRCKYTPSEETRIYYSYHGVTPETKWHDKSNRITEVSESYPLAHCPAKTALATRVKLLNW